MAWNMGRAIGPFLRYDPHDSASEVTVWYAADSLETALAEAFQETKTVDVSTARPYLCAASTAVGPLLDLSSQWSTRASCGLLIATAPHQDTQPWVRAIRVAYPQVAGLYNVSSVHPPGRCVVLWGDPDHPLPLPARPLFNRPLADPSVIVALSQVADRIGYLLT